MTTAQIARGLGLLLLVGVAFLMGWAIGNTQLCAVCP